MERSDITNASLEGALYMDVHQLVDIFCDIDYFCNDLYHHCQNYMLSGPTKSNRGSSCCIAIRPHIRAAVLSGPLQPFPYWLTSP
jgi:hypothetical protein